LPEVRVDDGKKRKEKDVRSKRERERGEKSL
jgi:hypothetical protein